MNDLCNALNIKSLPCFAKAFPAAMAEYAEKRSYIAEDTRIYEVIATYGIFEKWKTSLLKAAEGIRKDENLLRFVYLLKHVLKTEGVFDEILEMEMPESAENTLAYDFASLFSIFPLMEDMKARYAARKLPEERFSESLLEFEANVDNFNRQNKRPGLRILAVWLYKFIHGLILRVGRLNFEIFKGFDADVVVFENKRGKHEFLLSGEGFSAEITETETMYTGIRSNPWEPQKRERLSLRKSEWKPILKRNDPIVSVHIPSGGKLLPEVCEEAYAKMREILKTYYPDYHYTYFACEHSWLMDPHLADFLPEDSNIIRFQEKYTRYQNNANGKGVYDFLFFVPHSTPLADLPADTSLRKAIKAHYINGGLILEQGGLLFS